MKHIHRFLFITVILSLLVSLAFIFHPRQVYGVISDDLNGRLVNGATVRVGDRIVHSDSSGNYNLGWVLGTPPLEVSADGYLPTNAVVPLGRFPGQTLPITLTPNILTGTARDAETRNPLPGSTLVTEGLSTVTDEKGKYTLRRVRQGVLLSTSAPGYEVSNVVFAGQEMLDFWLKPTETRVLAVDLYSGQPLSNAVVKCGAAHLITDKNGTVVLRRLAKGALLSVQSAAHASTEYVYDGSDKVSIALRPNVLHGVIRDGSDKQPIAGATVAVLSAGGVITYSITGADGCYSFWNLPHPITLAVAAAGYDRPEIKVGPVVGLDVDLRGFQVKGIYVPMGILTNEGRVHELIDLVHRTELNAIVVDIKNDRGWLAYPSELVEAQRSGAYAPEVMDIHKFIALCRQEGIYTIARLVTFKDSAVASAYPEWAVRTANGEVWKDASGSSWSDPFRQEVQDYNVAIAKEVAALGFDELQFDYLRFPSDGAVQEAKYAQESTLESRCKAIKEFCAQLRRELQPYAVLLSADLFGLTIWVSPEEDMGVGQRVIDIAPYMDYLSPMLYPATFSSGSLQYDEPLKYPYEVVYRSCLELARRSRTRVRPWLQHYSWNDVTYGVKELRLQKKAASDAETYGWMFWNAAAMYNPKAFDLAKEPWFFTAQNSL